jgi:hypothetical protein
VTERHGLTARARRRGRETGSPAADLPAPQLLAASQLGPGDAWVRVGRDDGGRLPGGDRNRGALGTERRRGPALAPPEAPGNQFAGGELLAALLLPPDARAPQRLAMSSCRCYV